MSIFKIKKRTGFARKRNLFILLVVMLVLSCISISIKGNERREIVDYTYDMGNTVWEIAQANCPDGMDIREFAREIERVNGIENHVVYGGVVYKVPVYKEK